MQTTSTTEDARTRAVIEPLKDYPVREYVAAMARELALMARWDGDEALGKLLDGAADVAERPAA
ncbi:MAG TPA: hypothetical protein VGR32_10300 [Brevundimonas sp.]|uniref:hypothetical protein n=1 Tax=Brevundimonas sp. TaxID=1871086 RepID=UPI002DF5CBA8|nr:hypothetical protein [Brevundimonas sp.]